jgi:hypothetical protein
VQSHLSKGNTEDIKLLLYDGLTKKKLYLGRDKKREDVTSEISGSRGSRFKMAVF